MATRDDETFVILEERGSRRRAVVVAVLAFVAAGGMGALSYYLWQELQTSQAAEKHLAGEMKTLSDALELHRATSVDLDGKLGKCNEDLTVQKTAVEDTEKKRVDLDADLTACRSSEKNLAQQAAAAKELLAEFKSLTASFQKMIDSGKLAVVFRRGQMVVKLPAAILFPSGSAELSEEGQAALGEVASILRQLRGRRFTVAGHTDNVPVVQASFHDNWELSAARAVTVTKLLIAKGMPATSLVAAGYSEYDPVAANAGGTGRQKNRRIEIILAPNLKKMNLPQVAAGRRR
jgi:chemotaxis protein MotB